MAGYVVKRLIQAVVLLKCVMIIVFLLLHMTGDPVLVMLDTDATHEDIEYLRKLMGFDQPLHVQYGRFFSNALQGNFGESTEHGESAMGLVLEHFPATIEMAVGRLRFRRRHRYSLRLSGGFQGRLDLRQRLRRRHGADAGDS